jgi:hypothetical protein
MEVEINGIRLRVYECGKIEKWFEKCGKHLLKEPYWIQIKGHLNIIHNGKYPQHSTRIKGKSYITARIIYFAFNPNWDFIDSSKNNTIDHIDTDSTNNHINNLRVANAVQQSQNRKCMLTAKGYVWHQKNKNWRVRICINNKTINIGSFDTEHEAHQAYLDARLKYLSV